jgi:hypothetical protein
MGSKWEVVLSIVLLAVLGILGIASFIIKKKPEAKELLGQMSKFSGPIGIAAAVWGFYLLIAGIAKGGTFFITALLLPVTLLVFIGLGFIFGYGLVAGYLSAEAKEKVEHLRVKLAAYQIPLGFVALGLFVWWLIFWVS